jgi:hypothetical protein
MKGPALEEIIAAEDGEGVLPLHRMQKDVVCYLATVVWFQGSHKSLLTEFDCDPPFHPGPLSIRAHSLHSSFHS